MINQDWNTAMKTDKVLLLTTGITQWHHTHRVLNSTLTWEQKINSGTKSLETDKGRRTRRH